MRFLTPSLHGVLDYVAALALIVAPSVLGLDQQSPLAFWLSVAAGIGLIGYSLLTDYAYSMAKMISYKLHLLFDLAAAVVFVAAPWVFGFEGVAKIYYPVMGFGVLLVVAVS